MAAKDLITLARAYQALQGVSNVDALLQTLITAASDAIQKYCRRDFVSTSYDELYSGQGDRRLMLRQYPLISVESVRYRPVTVLKITNTIAANVQARVSVTSTGLKLVRVNAGVKTTDTSVTFAGNPTLAACGVAINALGNGWSAQVVGDATNYGSWPSADLYWPPSFPTFGGGAVGQGASVVTSDRGQMAALTVETLETLVLLNAPALFHARHWTTATHDCQPGDGNLPARCAGAATSPRRVPARNQFSLPLLAS
jgi:hypothetical protein